MGGIKTNGTGKMTKEEGKKEKGGSFGPVEFEVETGQARSDQLRNSIKLGHVSKCGAIPKVSNFLV